MFFVDKKGEVFEVRFGREDDTSRLSEMYEVFDPKAKYQGLPPLKTVPCFAWIRHLFEIGENYLAIRNSRIIGHAVLLPDISVRDGEYLVFVHQDDRGLGVGTELTRCAVERAHHFGLRLIWLTVDAANFIAIRLYRKFGFRFCDEACLDGERKMALLLAGEGSPC